MTIKDIKLGTLFLNAAGQMCIVIYRDSERMQFYNLINHCLSGKHVLSKWTTYATLWIKVADNDI